MLFRSFSTSMQEKSSSPCYILIKMDRLFYGNTFIKLFCADIKNVGLSFLKGEAVLCLE